MKLILFFVILLVSVLVTAGISTYYNQDRIYRGQIEENLENIVEYFSDLMQADGDEFVAYQNLMIECSDDVLFPADFDGDYRPAKRAFYEAFNSRFPGKALGKDIDYMELPKDIKVLYVTYKHEYWTHIFESATEDFGVDYTYYVVPTGTDFYAYYMIDPVAESKLVDGKEYKELNAVYMLGLNGHEHLWRAWETGVYTPGFDITNNEFGINYCHFTPLVINGEKYGVIGSDVSIERVNRNILNNTLRQLLSMAALFIIICFLLAWYVGAKYISRLVSLKHDVINYTNYKDSTIADDILKNVNLKDEISDLSEQVAFMIKEIDDYTRTLIEKNNELEEAQYKIKTANELANKDSLTGIRNKKAYDDEVYRIEYRIATEGFTEFGIAMIDLNFLKYINDNFGHEKGNIAIKRVCQIVCVNFAHSPVFRIGGDEFVVILMNSDYVEAELLVDKFKNTVAEIHEDEVLEPWERVSAAIGWTRFDPAVDKGVQNVFKRADDLMYKNKKEMKATRE